MSVKDYKQTIKAICARAVFGSAVSHLSDEYALFIVVCTSWIWYCVFSLNFSNFFFRFLLSVRLLLFLTCNECQVRAYQITFTLTRCRRTVTLLWPSQLNYKLIVLFFAIYFCTKCKIQQQHTEYVSKQAALWSDFYICMYVRGVFCCSRCRWHAKCASEGSCRDL